LNLYQAAEFRGTGLVFSAAQGFAYFHFASCFEILEKRKISTVQKLLEGIPNAGIASKENLRKPAKSPLTTGASRTSG